ncbi:MAG TPA: CoA-transferase [Acidimicrobiales bacterium]|nr:CoA-transferase [Acidimicrobiales bacterium]
MGDKRTTVDDIVAELRSGMTVGIGGWGSRRKPMAVVRAICRSDLTDLTVVASEDATFGLPEVDRGALGAATHLARLVP